jgi:hypothetical protein
MGVNRMKIKISNRVYVDITGDYGVLPADFFHLDASRSDWIEDRFTTVHLSDIKMPVSELVELRNYLGSVFPKLPHDGMRYLLKSIGRVEHIPHESVHTVWFMEVDGIEFLFNLVSLKKNCWTIVVHDLSSVGPADRFWKPIILLRPKPARS